VRIFSTHSVGYSSDSLQVTPGVDNVAFHNPGIGTGLAGKDVMVAYNNTTRPQPVTVRDGHVTFSFTAAPDATDVAVIPR
jgi:hypothetical protein